MLGGRVSCVPDLPFSTPPAPSHPPADRRGYLSPSGRPTDTFVFLSTFARQRINRHTVRNDDTSVHVLSTLLSVDFDRYDTPRLVSKS